MQIEINNVIASEETTCTGDAVTTVFSGKSFNSRAIILHNVGAINVWYKILSKGATTPTTSTFSSTKKMGTVAPGETITIPMNCNGATLYLQNDSGASTTCAYCAYAVDGTAI